MKIQLEFLEDRCLLAGDFGPVGSEFQVNTFTTNNQAQVAVAMDGVGNFVAVWQSDGQDGSGYGIYAQRYDASGVAQGIEFRVNTHTTSDQINPSVAMDSMGNFVVVWESYGQDGSGYGIHAQRYSMIGVAQDGEFRINTHTTSDQLSPSVAMDSVGNFVVAWQSNGQDGSSSGIYAQRYNASGVAQGGEFLVNTYTTSIQSSPSVALDSLGNFVVTWQSFGQDGSGYGIYAQRYDASGVTQGSEFRINTYTTNSQTLPSVAMDDTGNFMVGWESFGQDGSLLGIYARRFDASGVAQGSEFRVNSHTTNSQSLPSVAMDSLGNFAVAWQSTGQDGAVYGIYAQRFDAGGVAQESEFRVNTHTSSQTFPSVAMDSLGNFVVAWMSSGQDGSGYGIYAQRFGGPDPNGFGPIGLEFQVNTYTTGNQHLASVAMNSVGNFVVAWRSFDQDGSGYGIYAQRYNASGIVQGSEFQVNTYTTNWQSSPSVAMDSAGNFVVVWQSSGQDGSGGSVHAQRYNANGIAQGSEFQVNTYTTNNQNSARVAMDSAGNFVVAWQSNNQDGSGYGIYAQRYNASGIAQGEEFQVNTYTTGVQRNPSIAMDGLGNFVVAWTSSGQDGSLDGVYAQRYSANGIAQGGEFLVNSYTTAAQNSSSVAMGSDGSFVIAWRSNSQDGANYGIYAQRYDASGVPQESEFQVNTYTTSNQIQPSVAMDSIGNFVVVWQSFTQDGSSWGIYAQRYNEIGIAQGGEFRVNAYTTSQQRDPSVAMDSLGNFVVAWTSATQDGSLYGIYAQRFGVAQVNPVAVADVQVRGTGWNVARDWFSIPDGSDQLRTLPWINIDQVRMVFTGPVTIDVGDLEMLGINVPDYAGQVSGFSYDEATFTATWTLLSPIGTDKILLRLADGVIEGSNSLALDGDWTNGTSEFPSGDGTPGGAFAFRFNVLPGNADYNGTQVNAVDWNFVRARLFEGIGDPNYTVFADINGDGVINPLDWNGTRARLFNALPDGEPSAAADMLHIFRAVDAEWVEKADASPANEEPSSGRAAGLLVPTSPTAGDAGAARLVPTGVDAYFTSVAAEDSSPLTPVDSLSDPPRDRNRLGSHSAKQRP